MKPVTLALDMAGTTGWAVWDGAAVTSGTWDIRPRRGDSPGMRYVYLRARLVSIRDAYPTLSTVYYEQAHHRGGAATEYAHGCVATLQAWCAEHGVEHGSIHTQALKKATTGRGNASKNDMIAEVCRWGFTPTDDNEADALAILRWAASECAAK